MAKYSGSGWHKQSLRHSRARRLGHAGGTYAGHKPFADFDKDGVINLLDRQRYNKKHYGELKAKYTPQTEKEREKPTNERISDDALKLMYYYRLVWFKATGKRMQNGLFEKFMTSAFDTRQYPDYADEWARRFMTGNPTIYMDGKRKKIYMELLEKNDIHDESLFLKKEGKIEDEWTERLQKQIDEQKK